MINLTEAQRNAATTTIKELVTKYQLESIVTDEKVDTMITRIAEADWRPTKKDTEELIRDIKNDGYYYTMTQYQLMDPAEYYLEVYGIDINAEGGIV